MQTKPPKPKPCKVCKAVFQPRPMQSVCGPDCAREFARDKREREDRKKQREEGRQTRARLEELKTLPQLANEAQEKVNLYVRLRDAREGCISCNRPATWDGQWHASHYRSVGAASSVRFNLWNIHKACSICNHHKSGNIAEYTPRLISKIGQQKVDWLSQQNTVNKYTRQYLLRMKAVFAKKAARQRKRLEK